VKKAINAGILIEFVQKTQKMKGFAEV